MRVLGRGVAALIRDASEAVDKAGETSEPNTKPNPYLTPPELRARIRETLAPIFFDDSATISRRIESLTHPIRNDLTLASFGHLHDGALYDLDTKRMNAFRTQLTRKDKDTK